MDKYTVLQFRSQFLLLILLGASLLLFQGCGEVTSNGSSPTPNFILNGFGMRVERLYDTTYQFTITDNDDAISSYSVFGFSNSDEMSLFDPNMTTTKIRLGPISDAAFPYKQFTLSFRTDDFWFAIFADPFSGGVPFSLIDSQNLLLSGELPL